MPIFEYKCRKCSHEFEKLVRNDDLPPCPTCQDADVEKLLSLSVGISTQKTRSRTLGVARAKGKAVKKEQDRAHQVYIQNHIKDHS